MSRTRLRKSSSSIEPKWIMQVVALYDYDAEENDELSFREQDVLRVVKFQDDGWWQGYLVNDLDQLLGVFPSNYVQIQYRRKPNEPTQENAKRKSMDASRQRQEDDGDEDEEQEQDEEQYDNIQRRQPQGQQTKSSVGRQPSNSVSMLKQKLGVAEKLSRAAQEARRKAEQERLWRGQQWLEYEPQYQEGEPNVYNETTMTRSDEGRGNFDDDTSQQWREQAGGYGEGFNNGQQEEQVPVDGVDEYWREQSYQTQYEYASGQYGVEAEKQDVYYSVGVASESIDEYWRGRSYETQPEYASEQYGVGVDEQNVYYPVSVASSDEQRDAASLIARQYRAHKQQQHDVQTKLKASAVIAKSLIRHAHRHQQELEQPEQTLQQPPTSSMTGLALNQQREKDGFGELLAIIRIQRWMRNYLTYKRWLDHVECERLDMIRQRQIQEQLYEQPQAIEAQQEKEAAQQREKEMKEQVEEVRRAAAEADAKLKAKAKAKQHQEEEKRRIAAESKAKAMVDATRIREEEAAAATAAAAKEKEEKARARARTQAFVAAEAKALAEAESVSKQVEHHSDLNKTSPDKREKRKVMKKEAVDLVKELVQQQLSAKLKDHDDKMYELQRMVTRLQDVIRQQSALIQDTTHHIFELEQSQQHKQHSTHTKSATKIPSSTSTGLPSLVPSKSTTVVRLSGIKAPKQIDRTSRLPMIASTTSSSVARR